MPQINGKMIAWVGVPLFAAGSLAIINSMSQGLLWEIPNSRSNQIAATAATTDATNKLLAAIESAKAVIEASRVQGEALKTSASLTANATVAMANATHQAALETANGLRDSTHEAYRAENSEFDQVTAPLFSQPAEKMAKLNEEIVRLKRELENENGKHIVLFGSGVGTPAQKAALLAAREEELATLKETTQKNWSDSMGMIIGAFNLGDLGKLYPSGNEPMPERRILQEDKYGRIK